jgi:site-specific recombinase XerD
MHCKLATSGRGEGQTCSKAKEIGIVGHFGWHTLRHTYATLLSGNGEDVMVVQELCGTQTSQSL